MVACAEAVRYLPSFFAMSKYTQPLPIYAPINMSKVPGQQMLIDELDKLDKVEQVKYGFPNLASNTFFFTKRFPGEPASKIYSRSKTGGADVLLFDPSNYIKGKVMNVNYDVSDDGKYMLLNLSEAGKETPNIRIMDVKTNKLLPEEILYAAGDFIPNSNNEISYLKFKNDDVHDPENNLNIKCMLHVIGTDVKADKELLSRAKNPELNFEPSDRPWINISAHSSFMFAEKDNVNPNKELFYAPVSTLTDNKIAWKPFSKYADEIKGYIARGDAVYCRTTKGNNNSRIIKVSLPNPDFSTASEILAGDKDWKISSMSESKDYLLIRMTKNGIENKIMLYDFATGKLEEMHVPLKGTIFMLPYSVFTNEFAVGNTSWTEPFNTYQYNAGNSQFSKGPFYVPSNYPGISNLESKEVEVASYDGTMVPLSIVYDKTKLKKDGSNICLLEGYGAYGFSTPPIFDETKLPLLNRGVVYAWAHVRGGGEKGEAWRLAGFKTTKQNTWKDFNACAEYLIKNGYTSSPKLGCSSASAGGILIGMAITERPDLYKVAIPKVGCLNALRMEQTPNGPDNTPEFGTVKDSLECEGLLQMDALRHVKAGVSYPAQFITTGFNDPRVDSWVPGKFAAAMQADNNPTTPTLLYVNYKGGHFGGTTTKEQFVETAIEDAFLLWQCGDPEFQPKE